MIELEDFAQIVEDMILQLSYPGFEKRSFKLGLPEEVNKSPAKLFVKALSHQSTLVKLAALRWFQERPGVSKAYLKTIILGCADPDEWVRREAIICLEKIDKLDETSCLEVCKCLLDSDVEVRKEAAKALGKFGDRSEVVINALKKASEDIDHSVRWKAQKSLRKLGIYSV